ncbi:MAG: ABC transporter ATP-binding protein/permease [Hyphomicrobiales bacterium]|nr:ABC transporter ATP-binding protein/permease [Hyphomicrobiales bacterium]
MAAEPSKSPTDAVTTDGIDWGAFFSEFRTMASALWASRQRPKLSLLGLGLVAVVGATAYSQIKLNAWNGPFYNALARKDMQLFIQQLGVFAVLAGVLLILNVAQLWLNMSSKVVLRQGLVDDLLEQWLAPARAFRLSNAGKIGENPDQRIQQDAQHLSDLTTDLGIGLLQSTLLLASFVGVLWMLSSHMVLSILGGAYVVPGYMVWCALAYAAIASALSWRVGRPLINLNAEHYAREADFRYALVRVNEQIDAITLSRGEADERNHIAGVFRTVLDISWRIVNATTRLTLVTAGYGWFTIIAPILVAAPAYFHSSISFGELMVIVGAFNQVQQALRWFVDNFSGIADWRATLLRVASFRQKILTMDDLGRDTSRIAFKETDDLIVKIDDLRVSSPAGCIKLSEAHTELQAGQRMLITGETGEEKSLVFRAVGGLWPWGSGRITAPPRQSIMFMPVRAYTPAGTLREAVAYPHPVSNFDAADIAKALADVGLEHLKAELDVEDRWDRRLTDDEKQSLAFARVVLQQPNWVVANDALDILNPTTRKRIREIMQGALSHIGLINVGHDVPESGVYHYKVRLVRDPQGPAFESDRAPQTSDQPRPAAEQSSGG